jgi:hypothetical protein
VLSELEGIVNPGLERRQWRQRRRLLESEKSRIGLKGRQRRRLLESKKSRIGLEGRQRRRLLESKKSRIGLKGRLRRRLLESKKSRFGLEGRVRTLLVGMHERRTWLSGTKGWHMCNKIPMKTGVQEMTEVVVRLELDDLLRMIERFLPTQLTVSPLAWKKNSLDSQLPPRIFLLKSPRTISVSVTMTINIT